MSHGSYETDGRKTPRLTRREEAERALGTWLAIVVALHCGCRAEDAATCAPPCPCRCRCHTGGRT